MDRRHQLENFFDDYARRFNAFLGGKNMDVEATAASFANCFVESSPAGVQCGKNDAQFRAMIPQGYAFYNDIGVTAMDIQSKETTLLDDFHSMVKVHWNCGFTRKDGSKGNIEFDVIYFVNVKENVFKIFAYITGDEQAALKQSGLI